MLPVIILLVIVLSLLVIIIFQKVKIEKLKDDLNFKRRKIYEAESDYRNLKWHIQEFIDACIFSKQRIHKTIDNLMVAITNDSTKRTYIRLIIDPFYNDLNNLYNKGKEDAEGEEINEDIQEGN